MKILKEDRGISLVEVVASIVLITIILISFYNLFIQNAKVNSNNYEHHTASAFARQLSADLTSDCSLVKSNSIPSKCTYDSGLTQQGTSLEEYPYQIIHATTPTEKNNFYTLRKVTIKVWNKGDNVATDTPKIVTYTFQREVIEQ